METAVLRKLTLFGVICGLAGLTLLGAMTVQDGKREWKAYQEEYKERLLKEIDPDANPDLHERVAGMKPEIKQIVIDELDSIDRCTTCHMGIEDPLFTNAEQPLTTHPNPQLLELHPVETFGCTICHGGQGTATTYDGASHQTIAHWPEPMVRKSLMQSRCGHCHENYERIGAEKLVQGRNLFEKLHCSGCHKVNPGDGAIAPSLTDFADKDPGHFDFTHLDGDDSKQNWVLEHFHNPQKVSPGSPMRIYAMNKSQIEALTTYVLSLTERAFPLNYYSRKDLVFLD